MKIAALGLSYSSLGFFSLFSKTDRTLCFFSILGFPIYISFNYLILFLFLPQNSLKSQNNP
ncbi:transmembrane protein, putative [Medicago truncatula]|uniref:Transmembrane protein, putative n=1 Tax=Medicago truncatula TaxID=3880 RepID=G7JX29_MEDTR|nr:transmembrane protein, putative [Medicago truncatula]